MNDNVEVKVSVVVPYRGYHLTIEQTGKEKFIYTITGGELRSRIRTDVPLQTAAEATDVAKMFVDEHLGG